MNLVLLGAPGAGKGTQAERISKKYAIPAISTGALLREAAKGEGKTAELLRAKLPTGELISDEIVLMLLLERIAKDDCQNGFILDGFPRSAAQAEALEQKGIEIDKVLSIEVPDEEIVSRLTGRRVCAKCGATYHIAYNPPKTPDRCDKCGGELTLREDDKAETVKRRLEVFHQTTEQLKEFYLARGKLALVIGQESIEDTTLETFKALEGGQK